MATGKRISLDMFDEDLQLIISSSSNIVPINSVSDLPTEDTGNMYRVLSGVEKHNIYTWDDAVGKYELIGADDRDIRWNDVLEKPLQFNPISHTHTEADVIGLDKYTKEQTDVKLESKANTSHIHLMSEITGLVELLSSKVNAIQGMGLTKNDFTDALKSKLEMLSDSASVSYDEMLASLNTHQNNTTIHLKTSDITAINSIAGKTDKTYVDSQLSAKAPLSTLQGHTGNTVMHVTQADKDNWNNYQSGSSLLSTSNRPVQYAPKDYYAMNRRTIWENYKDTIIGIPNAGANDWSAVITIIPYHEADEDPLTQIAYCKNGTFTRTSIGTVTATATWGVWNKYALGSGYSVSIGNTQPTTDMWYKEV